MQRIRQNGGVVKKSSLALFIAAAMAIAAVAAACVKKPDELITRHEEGLLGSVITISAYGDVTEDIFDECFDYVRNIDVSMSVGKPSSEVAALNESGEANVSDDVYALATQAIEYSKLSGGAFDISVGAVADLWKSGDVFDNLPDPEEIAAKLPFVGYEKITLAPSNVISLEPNARVDLGGIAKGFACDKALDILKKHGVKHALLDFGGNIYAHGHKPDGSPWRVGVRNPVIGADGYICVIEINDKTVVTSGGYERFFEKDGKRYHHILDPKTGYPIENELLSATIITERSTDADALSTACFVLGLEDGTELIENLDDCEAIFVTELNEIYVTSGLSGMITVTDESFTLKESY
jgi:thiamine biosynthesis lipoprotein